MIRYRSEIDGLRAIAVIPVILFHAGFQAFGGGFVGVDVFFVISGYLITSIIITEKKADSFTIMNFYERRARRILPALFMVMFACVPFAWLWLLPEDMKRFSQSLIAVSGFVSNILFWITSSYFESDAELKPLLHTWSLAVEEQYYLVFPIFLILTWNIGKRFTMTLLSIIAIFSFILAQWGSLNYPEATFYLLPARIWELLMGASIAYYHSNPQRLGFSNLHSQIGSLIGLLLIIYAVFVFDKQMPFPGVYALIPTLGAVLIILFGTDQTVTGKLLGSRFFVGIGLISYSAYLWHQPLFAFAKHRSLNEPSKLLMIFLVVAVVLLAYVSWKYVETPFRNKQRFNRNKIFVYAFLSSVFFIAFGLAGHLNRGYPGRMPSSIFISEIEMPMLKNGYCFYNIDSQNDLSLGAKGLRCWLGNELSDKKGILFGDSFAGQYEPLWDMVGSELDIGINSITTNWCQPSNNKEFIGSVSSRALQQCIFNRRYLVDEISKYDFVILAGNWGKVLSQNKMKGVLDLIDFASSRNKLVILMPSPKQFDVDVMAFHMKSLLYKSSFDINKVSTTKDIKSIEANVLLEKFSRKYKNVLYIDRDALFAVNGLPSNVTKENIPFSLDGSHISVRGSKFAALAFLESKKYREFKNMLR